MMNQRKSIFIFVLLLNIFPLIDASISNAAIGILAESNLYLAQIKEFNSNFDSFYRIYHHRDEIYPLQSLTSNFRFHRCFFCSATTIYSLDLRVGSTPVPILPVDDTPCRSSLTYLSTDDTLLWTFRRTLIQYDFDLTTKNFLWNSSSTILDFIGNETLDDDQLTFYISVHLTDRDSAILRCQSDRLRFRLFPFENCFYVDSDFDEAVTLAMNGNRLYVGDRRLRRIFVLTISSTGYLLDKQILPLNSSTIADIQSMFFYENHLIWSTNSGHIRIVSLTNFQSRTLFWFDEPLISIRLVSFGQWPSPPSTTTSTTTSTTMTTTTSSTETSLTTHSSSSSSSTTSVDRIDSTSTSQSENNSWKATAYVTSIILGLALFLCAAMITCVLLNYRLGRVVPNSFTNIFHILRNRTTTNAPRTTTISMERSQRNISVSSIEYRRERVESVAHRHINAFCRWKKVEDFR